MAGKAVWNLLDQMLSAATNVALAVLVVRAAGAAAFDAFAVGFLLFSLAIGVERSLVGQALGIRHSSRVGASRRRALGRASGAVLGLAVPLGLAMVLAGLLVSGQVGATLVATGAVLPFLLTQDMCRYAFFAAAEARRATANDALWALVQFTAMGVLLATGRATAVTLVLAWGGAAGVCAVVALVQLRVVPAPLATWSWLREHRDLVGYLLGDYLLTAGAFNGGYLLVGSFLGDHAVGSIRAAQVLLGPLGVVAGAAMTFGVPELARRATQLTSAHRRRVAFAATGGMATLSALYIAALLTLPDSVGELVFAEKWHQALEVLPVLAFAQIAALSALGPAVVVYALGQTRRTFRIMLVEAPLVLVLMIGGAVLFGVPGAVWGQLVDQVIMIVLWFGTLRLVLAEHDAGVVGATGTNRPMRRGPRPAPRR